MTTQKTARLEARITLEQERLIQHAAEVTGVSKTEFVTTATVESAHEVLADQRSFSLSEAAWVEFNARLNAPGQFIPELAKAMSEPSVFSE